MKQITISMLKAYEEFLRQEERGMATITKYICDVQDFSVWIGEQAVTKDNAAAWKAHLQEAGYAVTTINAKLSALNGFFRFAGWEECRVRLLKVQRRIFCSESRELTVQEYEQLVRTAQALGRERLALLMEAVCATGVRVSEIRYLTVEAARQGKAEIALKGKIRTILLPVKLCKKLLKYAKKQKIVSGEIFLTKNGSSLSRKQIWAEMKALCRQAGVDPDKVFPHNLRHLFARVFYKANQDIVLLADILGHSSIETTRIYLISTGAEHRRRLDKLGLVS